MSISRDACLQALREAADELGHAPTVEEYKALDVSPSYNTIIARYGTWLEALDHVDADRKSAVRYSREDCIEALQAAAEELGEERAAVEAIEAGSLANDDVPASLPLDQRLTAKSYHCVRKDEARWVAVVEVDQPYKSRQTRLYHWSPIREHDCQAVWEFERDGDRSLTDEFFTNRGHQVAGRDEEAACSAASK
jgi:hypothetical protein